MLVAATNDVNFVVNSRRGHVGALLRQAGLGIPRRGVRGFLFIVAVVVGVSDLKRAGAHEQREGNDEATVGGKRAHYS